jgi:hypothetical protein
MSELISARSAVKVAAGVDERVRAARKAVDAAKIVVESAGQGDGPTERWISSGIWRARLSMRTSTRNSISVAVRRTKSGLRRSLRVYSRGGLRPHRRRWSLA